MYCSKCGKELEDTWNQCPYCGCEITKNDIQPENHGDAKRNSKKKEKANKKKKKLPKIILILIILIVGICIVAGLSGEEEKTTNIYDVDFIDLIGASSEKLEELHIVNLLKSNDSEFSGYYGVKENILVNVDGSGMVTGVLFNGNPENLPAFCGVRIGMGRDEAGQKLAERFNKDDNVVDEFNEYEEYVDNETGGRLEIMYTMDDKVTSISYDFYGN